MWYITHYGSINARRAIHVSDFLLTDIYVYIYIHMYIYRYIYIFDIWARCVCDMYAIYM